MIVGIVFLVLAYCFSQFFRMAMAVMTPVLGADLGAAPDDLAFASGMWFLAFALMQIPVGEALDRLGPRRSASIIFILGTGIGAALFAMAQTPLHITVAMILIGIGCSPVLMAAYFIFARCYPPAVFATLAAVTMGLGNFGNVAGSAPLAAAINAFGWRHTMWGLSIAAVVVGIAVLIFVRDPERAENASSGSVLDVLKIRKLWLLFPLILVSYGAAASLRGLWTGPYLRDVFGADTAVIGNVTLVMGLTMILGTLAYGPLDRILGTRKWLIFGGNAVTALLLVALSLWPSGSLLVVTVVVGAIGLFGAAFPVMIAHGKSFVPPHLTGRGVSLLNMFSIGGTGLLQVVTGGVWRSADARLESAAGPYQVLFLFLAALLAIGLAIYLFSEDRMD